MAVLFGEDHLMSLKGNGTDRQHRLVDILGDSKDDVRLILRTFAYDHEALLLAKVALNLSIGHLMLCANFVGGSHVHSTNHLRQQHGV